jgi:hypothetical protein
MQQEFTRTEIECNVFAVYPSKYRGVLSAMCCIVTVAWGVTIAMGVPSKMAILYVVMVIPAVMGIVPVEEKVKAAVSYARLWGLRWEDFNYYTCNSDQHIHFTKHNIILCITLEHNLFIFNITGILTYIVIKTLSYILCMLNLFRNNYV